MIRLNNARPLHASPHALVTHKEAEQEALIRWGKRGTVLRRRARQIEGGLPPYAVGTSDGQVFETLGHGETWEEAFRNADRGKK